MLGWVGFVSLPPACPGSRHGGQRVARWPLPFRGSPSHGSSGTTAADSLLACSGRAEPSTASSHYILSIAHKAGVSISSSTGGNGLSEVQWLHQASRGQRQDQSPSLSEARAGQPQGGRVPGLGVDMAWLISPPFTQVTIGMFLLSGDPCFKT